MVNLNRNNSNWSFEERRKINENWAILESMANSTASGNNGLKQEVDQLKVTVGQNTARSTNALQTANQAKSESSSLLAAVNESDRKSDQAKDIANEAKTISEGIDGKVNQANETAQNALNVSGVAESKSDNAIEFANESKETAEFVQTQFNLIVAEAGDNNPEVVLSRTDSETQEIFTNLPTRLDTQHKQVTERVEENTKAIQPYNYTNNGIAFYSNDTTLSVYDNHASWTHGTVSYDEEDDRVVLFYDLKPFHSNDNNRVLMRKKIPNGGYSDLVVVADRVSEGISCKTQSSGIAPNGDYLSLVWENANGSSYTDARVYVYRSTDKGVTFNKQVAPVTSGSDINGFLVLRSGRILIHQDFPSKVLFSDDNGLTWNSANPFPGPAIVEPAWCELSDGTIVAYYRRNTDFDAKYPAYFTSSIDGGRNWTTPVASESIVDFTNSNGHMIYHEESKTVEFIHHSRYRQTDGFASLYVSVAYENDVKNDRFGEQIRIDKLSPQQVPIYNSTGDSGYIGATKDKYGTIHGFYYNGTNNEAQICYLSGKKSLENKNALELDLFTGEKIENGLKRLEKIDIDAFELGGINTVVGALDANLASTNRIRLKKHYQITGNTYYTLDSKSNEILVSIRQYDENFLNLSNSDFNITGIKRFKSLPNARYVRLLVLKSNNQDINVNELENLFYTDLLSLDQVRESTRGDQWMIFERSVTPLTIPNAFAPSDLTFEKVTAFNGANFASIDQQTKRIIINKPGKGLYEINGTIEFANNSIGHRALTLEFNYVNANAVANTQTNLATTSLFEANQNAFVTATAAQTSGAPLNINRIVVRIRKIANIS